MLAVFVYETEHYTQPALQEAFRARESMADGNVKQHHAAFLGAVVGWFPAGGWG